MKTFDINVPSQHKQRKVANAWVGDGIVTEDCPFTFPVKEKSNERQICSVIFLHCRNGKLNHTQVKNNEIHIKVCGDHGGGSFKASYEIVNVDKPNSKDNTVVFSIFEAKDYRSNLKIGLLRFKSQIDRLQEMEWR